MIKNFKQFKESISGTELIGQVGPNYGNTKLQNKTITQNDTGVIYSEITGQLYTWDDYNQLYQEYLKLGGKPLHGFNKDNLENLLNSLN
jgi:hypothetical protein